MGGALDSAALPPKRPPLISTELFLEDRYFPSESNRRAVDYREKTQSEHKAVILLFMGT